MLCSAQRSSSGARSASARNSASSPALSPPTNNTMNTRFHTPIQPTTSTSPRPLPYHLDLAPSPSPLRPHCPTKDHLRLWCPAPNPLSIAPPIASEENLDRILQVLNASWQDSTKATYGAGLLVFHIFCDQQNIPEPMHCPTPAQLVLAFLSCCVGAYAGATLSNYATGLRAWHTLHGQPWLVDPDTLKQCLEGATKLAPPSSKRPLCAPFTTDIIASLKQMLSLNQPLDAAIFTCMAVCFWCIARLGEFTVMNLKAFNPAKHIMRSAVSSISDCHGLEVIRFDLPWTKMTPSTGCGKSVQCAKQEGPSDPITALHNHFHVNPAPPDSHLFAWRFKDGSFHPLTRKQFLSHLSELTTCLGLANIKGHSLCIGGTLEYLLRGIPFEVVQSQGCWAGKAFSLYLCKHAMILAPYLQAELPGNKPFTRYAQPPVR